MTPWQARQESNLVPKFWRLRCDLRSGLFAPPRGFDPRSTLLDRQPSTPADSGGIRRDFAWRAMRHLRKVHLAVGRSHEPGPGSNQASASGSSRTSAVPLRRQPAESVGGSIGVRRRIELLNAGHSRVCSPELPHHGLRGANRTPLVLLPRQVPHQSATRRWWVAPDSNRPLPLFRRRPSPDLLTTR